MNVRYYLQKALKFKLHFNSKLNAETTCEKCLHMCDTVALLQLHSHEQRR